MKPKRSPDLRKQARRRKGAGRKHGCLGHGRRLLVETLSGALAMRSKSCHPSPSHPLPRSLGTGAHLGSFYFSILHYAYALSDNSCMRGVSLIICHHPRVVAVCAPQVFASPA